MAGGQAASSRAQGSSAGCLADGSFPPIADINVLTVGVRMHLTPEQTKRLQEAYSYLTNFESDDPAAVIDPSTYRQPDGDRLIHIAAQQGDLTSVALLIAAGEDINAIGDMGQTPAHRAAGGHHREVFDLLMLSGADGTIIDEFGRTPSETS